MPLEKETGIVLHARVISDADALITILGSVHSKAKYLLKGIKKSKNRPIVATEISALIAVDYYSHEKEGNRIVKEVNVINRFEKIKASYGGFLLLSYTSELLDRLLPDGEFHPKIYKLYLEFLLMLESEGYAPLILPFFKVRLLSAIGLFSGEFNCIFCHKEVLEKKSAFLNPENWEVICGDCQHIQKNLINEIRLLKAILHTRYSNLRNRTVPMSLVIEADFLLNSFLKFYIGRSLKSGDLFYKSLKEDYEFPC